MGDAMSRSCLNCGVVTCFEQGKDAMHCSRHKFPEEILKPKVTFVDKVKTMSSTGYEFKPGMVNYSSFARLDKFSLDKLIDDHWRYVSDLIDVTQLHSNPKEKAIAEFHYKTSAVHFWKHCMEHYNIKESTDE